MSAPGKLQARGKRHRRVRAKISGTAERPRISVFRSNRGISVQLIDDTVGKTITAVTWTEPDIKALGIEDQTKRVGSVLAERAKAAGIESVVFDRGGYLYHGRVKALAEAAREGGLKF